MTYEVVESNFRSVLYKKIFSIILLTISLWFMHFGPYNNSKLRELLDKYQDKISKYNEIKMEFDVLTKFQFQENEEMLDPETAVAVLKQIGAYLNNEIVIIND